MSDFWRNKHLSNFIAFTRTSLCMGILLLLAVAPVAVCAADKGDLINGQFDATSKAERRAIARDLANAVEKFASYLQKPKPSEIEWVEKEQAAIFRLSKDGPEDAWTQRVLSLGRSAEFHHVKLANYLDNLQSVLRTCIDREQELDIRVEMKWWALASHYLSDTAVYRDAINVLISAGRLPEDINAEAFVLEGETYNWYGRGIIEYIVIPYLAEIVTE